jgi:hypothetical protein
MHKEAVATNLCYTPLYLQFHKICFAFLMTVQLLVLYEKHSHQGYAQPISVLKTRSPTGTRLYSFFSTRTKLYSKTRMFLQIDQTGQVSGTLNCSSQFGESAKRLYYILASINLSYNLSRIYRYALICFKNIIISR